MTELTKKCLELNRTKRERLARILQESIERPEPTNDKDRFNILYKIATEMFGNGILTGCRNYNLVLGRRFIVYQMHSEGYSYPVIGKHLIRHHASAMHMQKMMENIFDYPDYYGLELAHWKEFQKRLKEYDETREI